MLLLIANLLIPILGYVFVGLARSAKVANFIFKATPILFLMNLVGIAKNVPQQISFFEIFPSYYFQLMVDKLNLVLLFVLGFVWTIFIFHLSQIFKAKTQEIDDNFRLKTISIFALLNFVITSHNIITILFFFNFLILINYFFAKEFLFKESIKLANFVKIILYLQSFLFLIAVIFSDKITNNNLIPNHFAGLILYFFALFFIFIIGFYVVFLAIKKSDIFAIFLFFGFGIFWAGLIIFTKILKNNFSSDLLLKLFYQPIFGYFIFFIAIISAILLFFIVLAKDLKAAFFYLLNQQFLVAFFAVILFAAFNYEKIYLPLLSIILQITLVFVVFANFIFYLEKLELTNKINGLFYSAKVSSSFLILSLVSLMAVFPTIATYEKFFIAKIIFQKELFLAAIIFIINFVTIVIFTCKLVYLLFFKDEKLLKSENFDLSNYDLNFNLSALVVLLVAVILPIFLQFKIGIFAL